MALKWPSMCWCAVKKLLTHSVMMMLVFLNSKCRTFAVVQCMLHTLSKCVEAWCPARHFIGHFAFSQSFFQLLVTVFTGQMTQPTVSKPWMKPVGRWDILQSTRTTPPFYYTNARKLLFKYNVWQWTQSVGPVRCQDKSSANAEMVHVFLVNHGIVANPILDASNVDFYGTTMLCWPSMNQDVGRYGTQPCIKSETLWYRCLN